MASLPFKVGYGGWRCFSTATPILYRKLIGTVVLAVPSIGYRGGRVDHPQSISGDIGGVGRMPSMMERFAGWDSWFHPATSSIPATGDRSS